MRCPELFLAWNKHGLMPNEKQVWLHDGGISISSRLLSDMLGIQVTPPPSLLAGDWEQEQLPHLQPAAALVPGSHPPPCSTDTWTDTDSSTQTALLWSPSSTHLYLEG